VVSGLAARLLLLLATAAVAVSALIGLFPSSVPKKSDPSYVDVIFESRLLVLTGRLVIVGAAFAFFMGALYVAASMIAHIWRSQWVGSLESHQTWAAHKPLYRDPERLKRLIEEDKRLIEASRESRRQQQELVERLRRRYGLIC
jgi:hypothetical protein